MPPFDVFISYAHQDKELRDELESHLSNLKHQDVISSWHDGKISPGTEWKQEIIAHLKSADIILLLISADFMASEFCYSTEMTQAIARHKANQARIIPIMLRPTDWKGASFTDLKILPTDGKPVTRWPSHDDAFEDIVQGIREAIDDLIKTSPPAIPSPSSISPSSPTGTTSMGVTPVPHWTVPYQRNPFFTGREEVLTHLHTQLQANQRAALSQPLAMSGLGGIGKTQTAVEYAYRYRSEYLRGIYWIKSSTPEDLASDFASLAQLLQLPEQEVQEQARIIKAVKNWFESQSGWLLIFDNADDLGIIAGYLPEGSRGHVLITTRASTMSGIAAKIEMQVMNLNEGARLLLKRAGMIDQAHPFEQVAEADLQQAYSIIQELGGLPLALDQAGAYLEETGEDLSSYLLIYKQQRADLLQRRGGLKADHAPVATTWTLAFNNLEDKNPAAIELIRLFAFLAPDAIPEELLTQIAHILPPSLQSVITNRMRFNEAIKALLDYSLIQRDRTSKALSIHRLVQAVIKDQMSKTQQAQQAEYIVRMISFLFPFNEDAPWTRSQRYLSHALLAVEYIKQSSITINEARKLLHAIGVYFYSRGEYKDAASLLQQSRAIAEKHLGPDHLDTAYSLHSLANVYSEQDKFEQAEALLKRTLTIYEKKLGLDHTATASILNNLANIYKDQGDYQQAELFYQRALAIHEKKRIPDYPETARNLNNLANLYSDQGKYEQAELLYERALAIFEKKRGPDHPETAACLNNLADLYIKQGKYEQAEPLVQRALVLDEKNQGPVHPETARSLTTLANLYTKQGKYKHAEPLYQRALTIFLQRLGADHLDSATCLDHFANFYYEQGKYEQSESLYQQALSIFEKRLGSDNPNTLKVLEHYSQLHSNQRGEGVEDDPCEAIQDSDTLR